ncbi:hypothetical protein Rsub_01446 [Raphidocelis subcapitata]|uniref:Globin n=1 Tax=Raphidocelis subcapitata TaxID=307507 RepID=A0A2V0NVH8_9CHLO|nr:hypothetical protein Rsub_01446 [Raphidocelis subcapitata]|eukprot:GBF88947.1 hypothetical protein Rsub_01446 [Raphidocelis subcapitata]
MGLCLSTGAEVDAQRPPGASADKCCSSPRVAVAACPGGAAAGESTQQPHACRTAPAAGVANCSTPETACPHAAAAAANGHAAPPQLPPLAPGRWGGAGGAARPALLPVGGCPASFSSESSVSCRVRFAAGTNPGDHPRNGEYTTSDSLSLKKIVDLFYDRILTDTMLSPFFKSVDVPKLKSHQVNFMALAFGGKELVFDERPDLNLRRIHYKLIKDGGLTEEHWRRFVTRFEDTLATLPEVPAESKAAALASVRATRHYFAPPTPEELAAGGAARAPRAAAA